MKLKCVRVSRKNSNGVLVGDIDGIGIIRKEIGRKIIRHSLWIKDAWETSNHKSTKTLDFLKSITNTRPHATVEVEISEDMQLVHFDFNSTPFELHDDNYVLNAMRLGKTPEADGDAHAPNSTANGGESSSIQSMSQAHTPLRSNASGRHPTSPPLPGILKARTKHEH
ncbi:hypothetical protein IFM89_007497 [Coptis chinensis]|uniref:Transcription factor DP C-terminal domain-containing protein n=1 Tax=Coptis chinensis TaxID=261450 RepID=A0A835HCY7_9MAGN|nr:hypothetical protein IFM89_007497 [Coptis chinensis]